MDSDLDIAFKEAFIEISKLKEAVAPDVMLKLYAYNKQANFGSSSPHYEKLDIRNAFKVNAWMQIKDMSSNDAKQEYIKLAKSLLNIKN
jgi:acyl-CoA-binding protein|tara:strand:+ start:431 stop:697 length:267 start_codon:yes stop_codon:yes gene_type:complete